MTHTTTRREFLKASVLTGASVAALGTSGCGSGKPISQPRWRGFNVLEMFNPPHRFRVFRSSFPNPSMRPPFGSSHPGVSISFGCRCRIGTGLTRGIGLPPILEMSERILERIDRAVLLGQKMGLHISLAMHCTPGYCVNAPQEPQSLWSDGGAALTASSAYWRMLAKRYRGISSDRLSFDLLNEPPWPSDAAPNAFYAALAGGANDKSPMSYADHLRFVSTVTPVILEQSPERLVRAEGLGWATTPDPGLAPLGLASSLHCDQPTGVAQYRAPALAGVPWDRLPAPGWPGGWNLDNTLWNRDTLAAFFRPFADLAALGAQVHCGEIGCYNRAPSRDAGMAGRRLGFLHRKRHWFRVVAVGGELRAGEFGARRCRLPDDARCPMAACSTRSSEAAPEVLTPRSLAQRPASRPRASPRIVGLTATDRQLSLSGQRDVATSASDLRFMNCAG